jgi:lisH domain-containing protein FOPNL
VKEALQETGAYTKMQAQLRAIIYAHLNATKAENLPVVTPPHETLVLNEMIREYLEFHGYTHALRTFELESGQTDPVQQDLIDDRRITKTEGVPSLYSIFRQ